MILFCHLVPLSLSAGAAAGLMTDAQQRKAAKDFAAYCKIKAMRRVRAKRSGSRFFVTASKVNGGLCNRRRFCAK